jgi:hypothetical protein
MTIIALRRLAAVLALALTLSGCIIYDPGYYGRPYYYGDDGWRGHRGYGWDGGRYWR